MKLLLNSWSKIDSTLGILRHLNQKYWKGLGINSESPTKPLVAVIFKCWSKFLQPKTHSHCNPKFYSEHNAWVRVCNSVYLTPDCAVDIKNACPKNRIKTNLKSHHNCSNPQPQDQFAVGLVMKWQNGTVLSKQGIVPGGNEITYSDCTDACKSIKCACFFYGANMEMPGDPKMDTHPVWNMCIPMPKVSFMLQ